jgi:tetratricopeptide (TPR) repeat protein
MAHEKSPATTKPDTAPVGDMTCDVLPAGDATCDVPPPAKAEPTPEPGGATCEFQASADAPAPEGTCDFSADQIPASATQVPPSLRGTQTAQPRREQPNTIGDATGEYHPETAAGRVVEGTCDFSPGDSEAIGKKTSLRTPGAVTQPASPAAPAPASKRAGRYDLTKFHAKGGMGEVWLAQDPDIGRPVALKRMLKGRDSQKLNFLKEAQVTGQLEHPGVIPVHELSIDENGQPFYIMKFVHGKTMKDVIKEYHEHKNDAASPREVQWLRLMNIFLDLCQTIAYAHSRGVIHRDIKPDNVMVGEYGETLVLDWGLAKVIGEPESDSPHGAIQLSSDDVSVGSITGTVKGTPYYFAPEVAAGKVNDVDQISDVYLLGSTLYYMITAKTPREGKSLTQLLDDAKNKLPVLPRQLAPTTPKPLDAICRKAMAHDKKDRYQTAAELATDVQRYLAGEPVSAYQETLVERTWRWVKRHRTGLMRAAAAVLIAAVATTAFIFIRNAEIDRAKAQALADKLKGEEDARDQIKAFRAHVDKARYFAASANPVAENVNDLDAAHAEATTKQAIDIADKWGADFDAMPLIDQRAVLKKELYDLFLELAQLKNRRDINGAEAYLARAAGLQPTTRSFHRLKALVLTAHGKNTEADAEDKLATDPKTPATALDFYLLGEQYRVESLKQSKVAGPDSKRGGLKELLARKEILGKAMEFYRQALKSDANHYWSYYQLGKCYEGLEKYAEAAEAFGTCIVLNPKAPWAFSSRGLALSHLEDRQKDAEADLDHALKLDSGFRPALLNRGTLYAKQKKYDKADADFAAVLAGPDDQRLLQAYFVRGQMNMERQKYADALPDLQQVADQKLPIQLAYLGLTRMYLIDGKSKDALQNLTRFLKIDPKEEKSPAAYEARGRELRLLAREFKTMEAIAWRKLTQSLALAELSEGVKQGGKSASLYKELGMIRQELGNMKDAADAYSKAITQLPKDKDLRKLRGWALVELGENKKAKDDFVVAVNVDPAEAEAQSGLGFTAAMLKQPDDALIHADQAMLHAPGDYLNLHNVACIYGALMTTDPKYVARYEAQALGQLRRAIELWRDGGAGDPREPDLMRGESAFPDRLKKHPEFVKLLGEVAK